MENIVENNGESSNTSPSLDILKDVEFKIGGAPVGEQKPISNVTELLSQKTPTENKTEENNGEGGETQEKTENQQQNGSHEQKDNTSNQSQQQESIEINETALSSLISDATQGRVKDVNQINQLVEENKQLRELAANPAGLFKDPHQKSIYEFLNDYKAADFDSGIQSYARLKSLDITNMKPEDAMREKYVMDNAKYGISRDKSELMFQAEFDEKYGKFGELADQFILKDGFEAKKSLGEMQAKFTAPKVDEQQEAQTKQAQETQEQYTQAVQKSLDGFKNLVFDINGKEENDFTFEIENTTEIAEIMNDPQGFLNSRWVGEKGFDAQQMKIDLTILKHFDKVVEGITTHSMTIAKEAAIRERNNITNKTQNPASNAGQGNGSIPKNMQEALMNSIVKSN